MGNVSEKFLAYTTVRHIHYDDDNLTVEGQLVVFDGDGHHVDLPGDLSNYVVAFPPGSDHEVIRQKIADQLLSIEHGGLRSVDQGDGTFLAAGVPDDGDVEVVMLPLDLG